MRKELKIFNTSFLDMVTCFLGAIMVLFLLAMRGQVDKPCAAMEMIAMANYDPDSGQLYSDPLQASNGLRAGDSLLVVIESLAPFPGLNLEDSDEPVQPLVCTRKHYNDCPPPANFDCEDCPGFDCSQCPPVTCNRPHYSNQGSNIGGYMPPGKRVVLTWDNPASNLDIQLESVAKGQSVAARQNNRKFAEWYNDRNRWGGKRSMVEGVKIYEPGRYIIKVMNKTRDSPTQQTFTVWLTNDDGSRSSQAFDFTLSGNSREFTRLMEIQVTATEINLISQN